MILLKPLDLLFVLLILRCVIRKLSAQSENLFDYARKCVQPGREYFEKQLATTP